MLHNGRELMHLTFRSSWKMHPIKIFMQIAWIETNGLKWVCSAKLHFHFLGKFLFITASEVARYPFSGWGNFHAHQPREYSRSSLTPLHHLFFQSRWWPLANNALALSLAHSPAAPPALIFQYFTINNKPPPRLRCCLSSSARATSLAANNSLATSPVANVKNAPRVSAFNY